MPAALRRLLRPAALGVAGLVLVAGCGSSGGGSSAEGSTSSPSAADSSSPSSSPSQEPSEDAGTVLDITVANGEARPQGKAMEVAIGEPVTLRIDSDAPGELHVHSTPEQEIAFEAGTTEKRLTFDRPGVVDVESHDLDQLLVRLEVR